MIGILYYQQGSDVLETIRTLIAYHSGKGRNLLAVYANPDSLGQQNLNECDGVRVLPDRQLMLNHYWLITSENEDG